MLMLCALVLGEGATLAIAASQCHFELNVMRPVIIHNFLHACGILGDACEKFRVYCIEGIELNRERIAELVDRSLMLVTALTPEIGYDAAAAIAEKALHEGTTLREAALATGKINAERFDQAVNPSKMTNESSES